MNLSKEQISILDHTVNRAAGQRFCGSSPDMRSLVESGLMRSLGKAGWCPDEFFTITREGVSELEKIKEE